MTGAILRIGGRDALLFRDGRPFAAELGALHARTLPLPLPSALAGALRTIVGSAAGWDWSGDGPRHARMVSVHGPILCRECDGGWEPVLPAPADGLIYRADDDNKKAPVVAPLAPFRPSAGGCDLPSRMLPVQVPAEVKPESGYRYWTWSRTESWLEQATAGPAPEKIGGPELEDRLHVEMERESGRAREGRFFATTSLSLGETWFFLARISGNFENLPAGVHPVGGEQRLARLVPTADADWPAPGSRLADRMQEAAGVRLLLATPALFAGGWRPGWLDASGEGSPPGANGSVCGVRLRLVSACVPRREAVSGWDLTSRSPKPVRWLTPAGAVYFFQVVEGQARSLLEQAWLAPVSDDAQDRRDGFGLALWGAWDPTETEGV